MLFELLTEYRNGNIKAINKLFTDMGTVTENPTYVNQIIIHDISLMNTIKRTFEEYQKPYKTCRKKCISTYCGDIEDMKQLFIMELYRLFDDDSFLPDNESSIFRALKYNVISSIESELKNQPFYRDMVFTDDDYYDYEIMLENLIYDPFSDDSISGYSGENKELLNVIKSVDIESICRKNAEIQIRVANLIKKYYKERDHLFPTTNKMLNFYKKEYGCEISDTEYSRALNSLFKLICDNTTAFKGLNINRRDYISRYDSNGNIKPPVAPIIQVCSLISDETLFLIDLVRQLDGYTSKEVKGDMFYSIIKKDIIREICFKNKEIIRWIDDVDKLSVEDYSDLLEGICIMVNDYVMRQIEYQIKMFMQRYSNYAFDVSTDELFLLANGKSDSKRYWTLSRRKDGLHIMNFIPSDDNMFTALKGKADITVNCKKIYQIGMCKLIISSCDKKIYCRGSDKELINVRREKNKYIGFTLTT